ncbi:MAG: DUF4956 domain-containing protein [Leptolyngbyaceae cyanobacterium MO_188.B28]|nr:DUF4956 domain-containing protein [Leptolyngbyaceae cyanobacterium MO_188.B28]
MLENFSIDQALPLSISALLVNLLLGAISSYVLSQHYVRFGKTNSNRTELANVFPILILTTVLIITVVKSSLALSLGLVGALSIVRFRTPIKEPEELGYLLIAIALGLGFGADQRLPTLIAAAAIMGILIVLRNAPGLRKSAKHNLYLNVEVPQAQQQDGVLEKIHGILSTYTRLIDMRRVDQRDGLLQATYFINCQDSKALIGLMDTLQATVPNIAISCIEQKGVLGS